jgi:myosin heavy subunit
MTSYDDDALLEMSVLKFAPIEPPLARSASLGGAQATQLVKKLFSAQERVALDELFNEVQACHLQLRSAVHEHEVALLVGEGDVLAAREALIEAMHAMQTVLARRAHLRQDHLIQLFGAREDAQQAQERLSNLRQDSLAQQMMETEHVQDVGTIKEIDAEIANLQQQIKALQRRRTNVKQQMHARQQERMKQNQRHEAERQALQSEPSPEQIDYMISTIKASIEEDEKEARALIDGISRFDELLTCMQKVETDMARVLSSDAPNDAEDILTYAIERLQIWQTDALAKKWTLLVVVIGDELEALLGARELFRDREDRRGANLKFSANDAQQTRVQPSADQHIHEDGESPAQ